MTTGFAYKTSADPGAPQLTNTFGSWIAVLDYLLDPLYWDKVFTGTNEAVYRAKAGNRNFLQVRDNQNYAAHVRAYTHMTSLTQGEGMYPPVDYVPGSFWFRAYTTTMPAPAPASYRAVVTDRFLLLAFASGVSGRGHDIAWFGDLAPERPGGQAFPSLRTQSHSSATPPASEPGWNYCLGAFAACATSYQLDNSFPSMSKPAVASSSVDAWGPVFASGGVGPAPYRRQIAHYNQYGNSVSMSLELSGHRLALPSNQLPTTLVRGEWVGRVPFLYQANNPTTTVPQHLDTFETVDGEVFLSWDAYGSSGPSNSYYRHCLMISDHEVGLP